MTRGLREAEESRKQYVRCMNGMFVKRVKEPNEKTIERELSKGPKKGQLVYELHFATIEGQLVDIRKEVHEQYGASWEFEIDITVDAENPEFLVIQIPYDSGYAKNIITRLPNISLDKDVIFQAYSFTPQGSSKERKGISMNQNGKKVASFYSREEPKGLPPMVELKVKGKTVWDDTDMMEFLENMMEEDVYHNLKLRQKKTDQEKISDFESSKNSEITKEAYPGELPNEEENPSDDLPF